MKRLKIAILLLAIGASSAQLTPRDALADAYVECPQIPGVSWWGGITHEMLVKYVDRRHGGNWSKYIALWENHLERAINAFEERKGVVVPRGKVDLERGEVQRKGAVKEDKIVLAYEDLGLYIPKLVQRTAVHRCLASVVAARLRSAGRQQSRAAAGKDVAIGFQQIFNPWKTAIVDRAFENATGYRITWKRFTSGARVIRAIAAGEIQIAVAGSSPIAAAASDGLDIELFWIVEDIGAGEALVAREGAGIIAPRDLIGKRIGVPFGSTSHFHTLFALEQFGLEPRQMRLFNMQPNSIALAWKQRTVDAAFVWNPVLSQIKKTGAVIITSGQLSRWGKATFDGMVAKRIWARENPTFMVDFVKTIAAADAAYREDAKAWTATSEPVAKILKLTGGNPADVPATLALYHFPTLEEQVSPQWLGGGSKGGAARALFHTSKFLLEEGKIKSMLPDYGAVVNDRWVKTVLGK